MNFKVNIFKNISEKLYLINHALLLCKLGSDGNKYKLFLLTIFLLINGITDTIPVILVIPFITVIGDPEKVLELPKVKEISSNFGIVDPNTLLLPFLILFLVFVAINTYIKLYLIDFIFFVKASIANTISKSSFQKSFVQYL